MQLYTLYCVNVFVKWYIYKAITSPNIDLPSKATNIDDDMKYLTTACSFDRFLCRGIQKEVGMFL